MGALTGLSDLMVISHGSTRGYVGDRVDPRAVRRDLGVRYMLAGSMRRQGGRSASRPSSRHRNRSGRALRALRRHLRRPVRIAGPDHEPDRVDHRAARARCRARDECGASGRRTWMPTISCFVPAISCIGSTRTISSRVAAAQARDRARSQLRQGLCHGGQVARVDFRARLVARPERQMPPRRTGWRARPSRATAAMHWHWHCAAITRRFCSGTMSGPSRCSIALWRRPEFGARLDTEQPDLQLHRRYSPSDRARQTRAQVFAARSGCLLVPDDTDAGPLCRRAITNTRSNIGRKVAAAKPIFTANLRFLAASLAALDRESEAHEVAHLLHECRAAFSRRPIRRGVRFS